MELNVQAIKLAMAEKEYNVASLARAAGISPAALNLWLHHGTKPRMDKLGRLANTLGVPVTAIIIN